MDLNGDGKTTFVEYLIGFCMWAMALGLIIAGLASCS